MQQTGYKRDQEIFTMISQLETKLKTRDESVTGFTTLDLQNIRKIVVSETEEIVQFMQEFANEFASNCITIIKSTSKSCDKKMDSIDFIARNLEFISQRYPNSPKIEGYSLSLSTHVQKSTINQTLKKKLCTTCPTNPKCF